MHLSTGRISQYIIAINRLSDVCSTNAQTLSNGGTVGGVLTRFWRYLVAVATNPFQHARVKILAI